MEGDRANRPTQQYSALDLQKQYPDKLVEMDIMIRQRRDYRGPVENENNRILNWLAFVNPRYVHTVAHKLGKEINEPENAEEILLKYRDKNIKDLEAKWSHREFYLKRLLGILEEAQAYEKQSNQAQGPKP